MRAFSLRRGCDPVGKKLYEGLQVATPKVTCLEPPPTVEAEQFLAMLRFEERGRLTELPNHLTEVQNGLVLSSR